MNRLEPLLAAFRQWPRWLQVLLPLAATTLLATFIALAWLFPDQPITARSGTWVGKYGDLHTRESYRCYVALNRLLLVAGVATFAALFASVVVAPPAKAPPDEE